MAAIQQISRVLDWDLLWQGQNAAESGRLLVFKFSPVCPHSRAVEEICRRFVAGLEDARELRIIVVDVLAARPVSQRIAADTHVRHESPQAILIGRDQAVLWHADHYGITQEALVQALTMAQV